MKIGLRIDVDTYRGTKQGVPELCRVLKKYGIKATFFFSVGPDNMGRHLWRCLKPAFLWKMLRTDAAGLYGPEIIFMGTAWPGPRIGRRLEQVIRNCDDEGHEIGLHAWDHHKWQAKTDKMSSQELYRQIARGCDERERILGRKVDCSAVPGWRCTEEVLLQKDKFPFKYNSDCRGTSIFKAVVDGKVLAQPQVPVTLPTYDEVLGRDNVTDDNYNDFMLTQLKKDSLNVLTIHSEAEGGKCSGMFEEFIKQAQAQGYEFVPLCDLIGDSLPEGKIVCKEFPGREGWLCCQDV